MTRLDALNAKNAGLLQGFQMISGIFLCGDVHVSRRLDFDCVNSLTERAVFTLQRWIDTPAKRAKRSPAMICPNCSSHYLTGPAYGRARVDALMTCGDCGKSFDAYQLFGVGTHKARRRAA
jgi:hypothetical protein